MPEPTANTLAVRRYKQRHPERVRENDRLAQRRRRAKDPEPSRAQARAYYAANKSRWKVYNGKRKAAERGPAVEAVARLVVLELNDGLCGLCGRDVDPANFHIDHILPLSAGGWHGYDNVQVAHPLCNLRKRAS